eukprot:6312824-Pyramimonas_sp.AAC.2
MAAAQLRPELLHEDHQHRRAEAHRDLLAHAHHARGGAHLRLPLRLRGGQDPLQLRRQALPGVPQLAERIEPSWGAHCHCHCHWHCHWPEYGQTRSKVVGSR